MTTKRRDRYACLRTLEQVGDERRRLRRAKRDNARHLEEDWEDVRFELTPRQLLTRAVGRLAASSSTFGNIFAGVQTVMSLLRGRPSGHCG